MKHKQYTIGVITNANGPSMVELKKMADDYGVTFEQVTFPMVSLSNFKDSDLVKKICTYDLVYYRTGMRGSLITELTHILDKKGIPYVNGVSKYPNSHQKIRQALIANRYDILQPKACFVPGFKYDLVAKELGPIFVVKPDDGSKGDGVALIRSQDELDEYEANKKKSQFMYQEYIENSDEYRVYTLGYKGVATYKKLRSTTDFRANMHVGGDVTTTEPEHEQALLTFGSHIAKCFGAEISGIDILIKDGRYYFLELNWQPGWEQLNELTGTDFTKATIQYLLKKAHHKHAWWKRSMQ